MVTLLFRVTWLRMNWIRALITDIEAFVVVKLADRVQLVPKILQSVPTLSLSKASLHLHQPCTADDCSATLVDLGWQPEADFLHLLDVCSACCIFGEDW